MKVLIITYYWPPAGGPGVQRWLKMVKFMKEFDTEPFILTVDLAKASYPLVDQSLVDEVPIQLSVTRTNSWEPLKIYSKLFGKEKVPYSGFANVNTDSLLSRSSRWVRGNLFIPDARKGWNKYAIKEAKQIISRENIGHVITTGPPHSTHLIGLELKKLFPINWIADFRDPWTDIYYSDQLLLSEKSKKQNRDLETTVLEKADVVLAVCHSNARLFSEKISDKQGKIKVLPNGFDSADFKVEKSKSGRFRIIYMGTLADTYSPEPVLKALAEVQSAFEFVIIGKVSPAIKSLIDNTSLDDKTNYVGYMNHSDAIKVLLSGDLLLHILPNIKGAEMGTTGKLFEYLAARIPILNIGPKNGDAAIIISNKVAGKTFSRDEVDEIKSFIDEVYRRNFQVMGDVEDYSRKELTRKLCQIIKEQDD